MIQSAAIAPRSSRSGRPVRFSKGTAAIRLGASSGGRARESFPPSTPTPTTTPAASTSGTSQPRRLGRLGSGVDENGNGPLVTEFPRGGSRGDRWVTAGSLSGSGARLGPEPLGEREHLRLGRRPKLGAQQLGVRGGVPARRRAIARGVERLHVAQRDAGVVGIVPRQARPPLDGPHRVAGLHPPLGRLFECRRVPARKVRALTLGPPLELLRPRQMEAVEKRPVVQPEGPLEVVPAERRLELPEVAGQALGIQAEIVAGAEYGMLAQGRAEDVERLAEQVAGVGGAALGPEEGEQLVATERTGMLHGQQREQGDALPQGGPAGDGAVRTVE